MASSVAAARLLAAAGALHCDGESSSDDESQDFLVLVAAPEGGGEAVCIKVDPDFVLDEALEELLGDVLWKNGNHLVGKGAGPSEVFVPPDLARQMSDDAAQASTVAVQLPHRATVGDFHAAVLRAAAPDVEPPHPDAASGPAATAAAAPAAPSAAPAPRQQQLRVDPVDGNAYTLWSFIEEYGDEEGMRRWAAAAPAPPDAQPPSCAAPAAGPGQDDDCFPMTASAEFAADFADGFERQIWKRPKAISCPWSEKSVRGPSSIVLRKSKGLRNVKLYDKYLDYQDVRLARAKHPTKEQIKEQEQRFADVAAGRTGDALEDDPSWDDPRGARPKTAVSRMQAEMLELHGDAMRRVAAKRGGELEPVQVHEEVARRFAARAERESKAPSLAFHGTAERHVDSILHKGLLLPDRKEHPVGVVHGSAHGRGIYASAGEHNVNISDGFAQGNGLLVCGMVDVNKPCPRPLLPEQEEVAPARTVGRFDGHRPQHRETHRPRPASQPAMMGRFEVHDDSPALRRCGGAYIAFEEDLVCPLFRVRCGKSDALVSVVHSKDAGTAFKAPQDACQYRDAKLAKRKAHHKRLDTRLLTARQRRRAQDALDTGAAEDPNR
eukprot:TRINITY_DN2684_c0_g1_i1.p1 TRINITY_DN2684_c0_g1~~TRINITY_DN2684_c0_g1_i1.p1  ORF type:complete len:608 (+),score=154.55 TRINITY_DN2684_c0_g1_i1:83-1906(+)